jgi:hypothetical protein
MDDIEELREELKQEQAEGEQNMSVNIVNKIGDLGDRLEIERPGTMDSTPILTRFKIGDSFFLYWARRRRDFVQGARRQQRAQDSSDHVHKVPIRGKEPQATGRETEVLDNKRALRVGRAGRWKSVQR